METAIEIIFLSALCLVSLLIYTILISEVIPKYLLRVTFNLQDDLGRGLKKFVYPDGRAVVYEPHPAIRKYINKYALFTLNGYKYLEIRAGEGVRNYTAQVVAFNNKNGIIGVYEVSETVRSFAEGNPFRLHDKTSYVALVLTSLNGKPVSAVAHVKMYIKDMPFYFLAVFTATFLQFVHIIATVKGIMELLDESMLIYRGYGFFILPSLAVGAVCLLTTVIYRMKKGVKVVLK